MSLANRSNFGCAIVWTTPLHASKHNGIYLLYGPEEVIQGAHGFDFRKSKGLVKGISVCELRALASLHKILAFAVRKAPGQIGAFAVENGVTGVQLHGDKISLLARSANMVVLKVVTVRSTSHCWFKFTTILCSNVPKLGRFSSHIARTEDVLDQGVAFGTFHDTLGVETEEQDCGGVSECECKANAMRMRCECQNAMRMRSEWDVKTYL